MLYMKQQCIELKGETDKSTGWGLQPFPPSTRLKITKDTDDLNNTINQQI